MAEKIQHEQEKKRFNEKSHQPTEEFIQLFIGDNAWQRLLRFEELLQERYDLNRELKFPFGNDYGWGFRYSHKKSLLLYVFFEQRGFCCTISINDTGAQKVEAILSDLLPEIQAAWINRYACGVDGGWLNRSVVSDDELPDLLRLLSIKVKPKRGDRTLS